MATSAPFSRFEFLIAWRYLRARRAEGGVSTMTWISLIGITLAVFALIVTLAVRAGFRAEFVDTILGANAHVTVYSSERPDASGQMIRGFADYADLSQRLLAVPGVTRAAPLIKGQAMLTGASGGAAGAEVFGISAADLATIPRIGKGADAMGDLSRFDQGIAIGAVLARDLGVSVGDRLRLVSPSGVKTAFGTSPRVSSYEVVYIFSAGRYDIDKVRVYMPFAEAQSYFNREGFADEFEVMVKDPDQIEDLTLQLLKAAGDDALLWSWKDASGAFLRALTIEDNVMFVILSILVLIASLNIVSGLIMLVKNKGRDIGILRTIGLTEGSILRVFFLCGAFTGTVGTICGVTLGCLFALYIDQIMAFLSAMSGGEIWDPSVRGIYSLPARLQGFDIFKAVALSLGLSYTITLIPARRAARMNPVEALRYE